MTNCVTYDKLLYFRQNPLVSRDLQPDSIRNLAALRFQKNDVVSITVSTFDPQLSAPFNLISPQLGAGAGMNNPSTFTSYIVDENGQIDFPVLGKINLYNRTATEAKDELTKLLKAYLKDPVVNIRLVSFRVSVLGEVKQPGTFIVSNDRVTILEALGMAGDLTPFSNRSNILVIREQDGVRQFGELNIQSGDIFASPFYYLKQGDVIYVEPKKDKEADIRDRFTEYLPWVTSTLTGITTIIAIINSAN
jgi:polysaccharide export outer membrane protein